ncbi:MAG: hypothetical protein C3F15_06010 [Holophagae bacterium]|nr:MAG: hypothetical protein C3F15_06010 [Holophagae bacterium]
MMVRMIHLVETRAIGPRWTAAAATTVHPWTRRRDDGRPAVAPLAEGLPAARSAPTRARARLTRTSARDG